MHYDVPVTLETLQDLFAPGDAHSRGLPVTPVRASRTALVYLPETISRSPHVLSFSAL